MYSDHFIGGRAILMLFFPQGYRLLRRTDSIQWLPPSEIGAIQERKFRILIDYVRRKVPYYQNLLVGLNINGFKDLEKIPFLTKAIIKKNFDFLKARNAKESDYKEDSTSGSTGENLFFLRDKRNNLARLAIALRGDSWTGWQLGEPVVLLWGSLKDQSKAIALRSQLARSSLFLNQRIISAFNMTDEDMAEYVSIINRTRPSLLVGYPSSLECFAKFINTERVKMHRPKGIITSGETLFAHQREYIHSVFGCQVLNRYGCREVGNIANECHEKGGLHVHSDHVVVEIVNENDEPCKPGELGQISVTDLDNFVFPFIRYKIGDLAIPSDSVCRCRRGLPLLENVKGRVFDLIIGSNGNRVPGNFFTLLRTRIRGIEKFQVYQRTLGEVLLKVVVNREFTNVQEKRVRELLLSRLGNGTRIKIDIVDGIPVSSSGKFRWVVSEITPYQ